ncbi:MAG: two-component system sensor histidine kinase NtrB [Magnetospiraceae bacterium]
MAVPKLNNSALSKVPSEAILASLSIVILVVNEDYRVLSVNPAAEAFFATSDSQILGKRLDKLLPSDAPVFGMITQSIREQLDVTDHGVTLESPRMGRHFVNLQAMPLVEYPTCVVLAIHRRSLADKMAGQLSFRGAARTVSSMAAMLAHEIKNPLSGIRGAAQLLEQTASVEDQTLTKLIAEESERINSLVNRMDMFADHRPLEREPINIHQVLEHVRKIAQAGFARHVRFVEVYDPSLPPVLGNRDLLIQVFLNLVKNAAEAAPEKKAEIILETAYRHGFSMVISGTRKRIHLPLVVSVKDNGPGVPEDVKPFLFEPFVSTKAKGSGLGLSLVAKLINDHGGVIDHERKRNRTIFHTHLPILTGGETPS